MHIGGGAAVRPDLSNFRYFVQFFMSLNIFLNQRMQIVIGTMQKVTMN